MIFLNYRQKDTAHLVGRLRDRLIALYGEDEVVFRDKMSLKAGDDWGTRLMAEVTRLPVFLAVVGTGWAEAKYTKDDNKPDRVGELRLDDPDDWVRKEIRTGLDVLGKLVVVVRATGTGLPPKPWLERRGIAELHDKQGILLRDDPDFDNDVAALTKVLEEKHPPLKSPRKARQGKQPAEPPPPPLPAKPSLPGKPPVCVGRNDLLNKLGTLFLPADPNTPLPCLAVAGVAGIGKSTAVLWFLHEPRVRERYGDNRHFIPLDGADSRAGMVTKLAEYLGVRAGPDLEARVLAELEDGERRMLVLDNAETPLQSGDRLDVETLLGTLSHLAHVGLVATLRPATHLPKWGAPAEVERLDPPDDLNAFHEHSGDKFKLDPNAAEFAAMLDGWPLVLRLAAEQAKHYRTLADFRTVWERKRAELLQQGKDKGSNFAVSVGLSLDVLKQKNPHTLRLLSVLARLPDGLLHADVPDVLGDDGIEAAAVVREVGGLVVEDEERMRMLAPLRDHLEPLLPFGGADRDRAVRFYCGVAKSGVKLGQPDAQEVIARLNPRATSCVAMIDIGLTLSDRAPAYFAADGLGKYARFTGLNFSEPLRRAVQSAKDHGEPQVEATLIYRLGGIAHVRSDHAEAIKQYGEARKLFRRGKSLNGQANCLLGLGDLARMRSDHAEAMRRFDESLPLFRLAGDVQGEANCLMTLGAIDRVRSDHAGAARRFNEALTLYRRVGDVLGQANCFQGLGQIALRRSDYAEAAKRLGEALPMHRTVGDMLGEANCVQYFGEIALRRSDHAEATGRFDAALSMFRRAGNVLGEANCVQGLGQIALERSDYAEAAKRFEVALPLYRRAGTVPGEADCVQGLGQIALEQSDHGEAARRFGEALPLYQRAGDVVGEADCVRGLGDIAAAEHDPTTARQRYQTALDLHHRIEDRHSIGETYQRLARIATDPGEQTRFVAAARAAWQSIDLPHLLTELNKEFPHEASSTPS